MTVKRRVKKQKKLWDGRFTKGMDKLLEEFSASISFDQRLYSFDIAGSVAHAKMLGRQGLVTPEEAESMVDGLNSIKKDIKAGRFIWDPTLEDVHMNIERALTERIGSAGEKLHTARSRNDQVAVDTRLYVKDVLEKVKRNLRGLRLALVEKGLDHPEAIMPGYTHMQRAQPILFAHHLLAYNEMFKRDEARLTDQFKRVDVMPLGSAALAGAGLPIDMKFTAKELGFSKLSANSMDAVSDRDYLIEFVSAAAIIMMHLSRLSEDMILWATSEFGFVDLPDELCTGSSIMPQKKNPDTPELIRGKTGRVYGHLMGLLTMMKGLPMAYDRDMQEDKEPLFDTADTLLKALPLASRLVSGMSIREERMRQAADDPFITAVDLADHLVLRGVPFRQAHAQVGRAVRYCVDHELALADLTEKQLLKYCPEVDYEKIAGQLTITSSIKTKKTPGGTSPGRVNAALKKERKELEK